MKGLRKRLSLNQQITLFPLDQSCYNGTGAMYFGRANVSSSGRPCRLWPDMDPPVHNYCRNPGGVRASPWCYVGVGNEKEFCDIEKCAEISE